ncbi:MAG TPA: hypothetical protein VFR51_01640 [Pyrinomonadaceae bacterium]|nr:hypothetical protein [Pyrinomonadaceae bacterium]
MTSPIRPPVASRLQKPNVKNIVQRKSAPLLARPTAQSRPMTARPVVQLYSTKKIANLNNKTAKVSASEHYIVAYEDILFVRTGAAVPHGFVRDTDVQVDQFDYNGSTYCAYKYNGLFLKDCLHTAEELINQKQLQFNKETSSRVKGIGLVFGQAKSGKNIEYAKREASDGHPVNERADPAVGEAYAIVGTGNPGKYPYHAAAVVAKDGNDTVTLEVSADYTDARDDDRTTEGELCMYEIGGNKSFHTECAGDYDQPITIVIVRK